MKIRCENCGAKYSISEDLLKKKVTKFRCKKCQHIMIVRAKEDEAISEPQYQASADAAGGQPYHQGHAEESTVATDSPLSQGGDISGYGVSQPAASHDYGYGSQQNMDATGNHQTDTGYDHSSPGYDDYSSTADPSYQQPAQEEDLYAGMETRAASAQSFDFGQSAPVSKEDQELDDEFERGFQEQEEEEATQVRRAPSAQEYNIAPNHQEQGIVSLKDARKMAKEVENVDTRVFGISELQKLRTEKKEAQKKQEEALRARISGGSSNANGDRWQTAEPPPVKK
jgi:predicted Zn finger-like uncharacterized protein